MKKKITKIESSFFNFQLILAAFTFSFGLLTITSYSQRVGINTTGTLPNASALLDVDAAPGNNMGLLIPRVALTATNSNAPIGAAVAISLLVYNTATAGVSPTNVVPGYYYWDGTKWVQIVTGNGNNNSAWLLLGNAGTIDGVNFLGTTDNVALNFRVNNQKAGRIENALATANTFFGYQAGNALGLGINNTAIGYQALYSNTSGSYNTANGYQALYSNTTSTYNTATGYQALYSNTTAMYGNTATGAWALYKNTIGYDNTATGLSALYSNTTGISNTATGHNALVSNTTGYSNTATGKWTLNYNSDGYGNTATGWQSQYSNISGNSNTSTGSNTLYANVGNNNTAMGVEALNKNTTGYNNAAIGYQTLFYNTTGRSNVAMGIRALFNNTARSNLVAIGDSALYNNGVGAVAAVEATANTAIGSKALYSNTTGSFNTALGYSAFSSGTAYSNSTALGANSVITASNNMVFGDAAVVGWGFGVTPGAAAIRVGTNATNGNNATLTLTGIWTNSSDSTKKYDIENISYGLKEIMQLHPVTYKLKETNYQDIGFLAQEVKLIVPEIVYGEEGQMTLSYGQMTSVLTKAMQEQQTMIDELKLANQMLKLRIEKLENTNQKIQAEK